MSKKILAVFDFDHTLVDANTDVAIWHDCPTLDAKQKANRGTTQWTDLMDTLLGEYHELGHNRDDVIRAMTTAVPFPDECRTILQSLRAKGADTWIASDSNTFFIDTILRHHNVVDFVKGVATNPATFDDTGRLRVRRLVDPEGPPHGCEVCTSVNMCKGVLVDGWMKTGGPYDLVVYVGDGGNDYCPSLRLQQQDRVLAREGYALARKLQAPGAPVKAKVDTWSTYGELLEHFVSILG